MKNKKNTIILLIISLTFTLLFGCKDKKINDQSKIKELVFYNWKDFTNKSILKDFEKETGIKIILKEYETRDMCIAQLQRNPGLCDVLILDTTNIAYCENQKLIKKFGSSRNV